MADDSDSDDPGLAGLSAEFQKVVGGMAGHTASFQKMLEKRSATLQQKTDTKKDDEAYFKSYSDLAIHEDMLKDRPRVEAYQKAISHYGAQWAAQPGCTIVDVGSGTGLLSMMCARAGAQRVLAVEASPLAHFLPKLIEDNGLKGRVEVRECRAEELEIEGGKVADVIVSEWMGYFLFFENMLPSVLSVRDRFLKDGGLMLPSRCCLYAAPIQDDAWRETKIDFWKGVEGFDMSALVPVARATASEQPQHRLVPEGSLLGEATPILSLDLYTAQESDFSNFDSVLNFKIPAGKRLDGMATWFDCDFGSAGTLLSTAPSQAPTHWRQTVFWFREPIEGGGGIDVEGKIFVKKHESFSRGYHVKFELEVPGRKNREEVFEIR